MAPEFEIQGHTRHTTNTGIVLARSCNDFFALAEDLQKSHAHLEESVEVSWNVAHEAYIDLSILQSQLEEERGHQSRIFSMLTNAAGAEVMHEIYNQLEVKRKRHQDTQIQCGVDQMGSTQRSSTSHSMCELSRFAHPPYHVLTVPVGGAGTSDSMASSTAFVLSSQRNLDEKNNRDRQFFHSDNPSLMPESIMHIPRTILNYSSEDETDATYTDSDGTEKDFEDDAYSFLNSRGRSPQAELSERSELSSETETCGVGWNNIPDFDEDSSDSNYQPPDWDMEDIWELDALWNRRDHRLFRFEYTQELRECQGILSDAGLSTDDSDQGYNQVALLRHFLRSEEYYYSQSLGRMLMPPKWEDSNHFRIIRDFVYQPSQKLGLELYRQKQWSFVFTMAKMSHFYPVDFEQRLKELLHSDHSEFFFDDEEWKNFAPHPISSRQAA